RAEDSRDANNQRVGENPTRLLCRRDRLFRVRWQFRFVHRTAMRCFEKRKGLFSSRRGHCGRLGPRSRVRRDRQQSARDGKGAVNGETDATAMKFAIAHRQNSGPRGASDTNNLNLSEATLRLTNGENLSRAEAAKFLECLISPDVTDQQIAAALMALSAKGETVEELAGMAQAMRNHALRLCSHHRNF